MAIYQDVSAKRLFIFWSTSAQFPSFFSFYLPRLPEPSHLGRLSRILLVSYPSCLNHIPISVFVLVTADRLRRMRPLTSGFDSGRADLAPQLVGLVSGGRHVRLCGSRDYFCVERQEVLAYSQNSSTIFSYCDLRSRCRRSGDGFANGAQRGNPGWGIILGSCSHQPWFN